MPLCVECGAPVRHVHKEFSKGNIRLTQCKRCGEFADKYVEFEPILLVLDMFLHKMEVYRHLLFNRMKFRRTGMDPLFFKLAPLYVLMDSYLKWARLSGGGGSGGGMGDVEVVPCSLAYEYFSTLFFSDKKTLIMLMALSEFCIYILGTVLAVRLLQAVIGKQPSRAKYRYNYVVMAVLLSSFGKLLVLLMFVWDYNLMFGTVLNVLVMTSNATAMKAFLDSETWHAWVVIISATLVRVCYCLALTVIDPTVEVVVL